MNKANILSLVQSDMMVGTPKLLKQWLANPPEGAVTMWVDPEFATELLALNTNNRPLSKATARKYARRMEAGEWRLTWNPIKVDVRGIVQDGQHRLSACIETGATFPSRIVFGVPVENFAFEDQHRPRGGSDIFAIYGVPNYKDAATVTRWVYIYDNTSMGGISGGSGSPIDGPDQLYNYYLESGPDRVQDSVLVSKAAWRAGLPNPSTYGGIHFVCSRLCRGKADSFFEKLISGEYLTRGDPVMKLRDRLFRDGKEMSRKQITADILLAWNAYRRNLKTVHWWSPEDRMPRAA